MRPWFIFARPEQNPDSSSLFVSNLKLPALVANQKIAKSKVLVALVDLQVAMADVGDPTAPLQDPPADV